MIRLGRRIDPERSPNNSQGAAEGSYLIIILSQFIFFSTLNPVEA